MKDIGLWLKGLAAAVIGGAVASAADAVASGNFTRGNLKTAAATGAILTLSAYMTKSPVGTK